MKKKKILFIDDEEAVLRWFKSALERRGDYEIAVEKNGKSALRTVRDFKPQMIFIDINMPDVEGSAVACEIKSDPAFTQIPIVFLTGAISAEEVACGDGKIGGQLFLAKPVDLNLLVNCIEKHLSSL